MSGSGVAQLFRPLLSVTSFAPAMILSRKELTKREENLVGKVIFHMAMSLDGFVAASNGDESSLYLNLGDEPYALLQDMKKATGAVVMGKRAFEMAEPDWYVGNYEYQVPQARNGSLSMPPLLMRLLHPSQRNRWAQRAARPMPKRVTSCVGLPLPKLASRICTGRARIE